MTIIQLPTRKGEAMSAPTYDNIHLPSEHLAAAFASRVMEQGRKPEVLAAIGDSNGARNLIIELGVMAESEFDVGGIINDDAYMNAVLDALKNVLTR